MRATKETHVPSFGNTPTFMGTPPVLNRCSFNEFETCLRRTDRPYEGAREAVAEEVRHLIDDRGNFDFGLVAKIPRILEFEPHHILFTAYSALPLADVFRGIFEYYQKETPVLGVVNTKIPDISKQISVDVHGSNTVVVDEYFGFGTTLAHAIQIAHHHGAQNVLPITGRWYEDADNKSLGMDTSTMSCTYADDLQRMGRRIAQLAEV